MSNSHTKLLKNYTLSVRLPFVDISNNENMLKRDKTTVKTHPRKSSRKPLPNTKSVNAVSHQQTIQKVKNEVPNLKIVLEKVEVPSETKKTKHKHAVHLEGVNKNHVIGKAALGIILDKNVTENFRSIGPSKNRHHSDEDPNKSEPDSSFKVQADNESHKQSAKSGNQRVGSNQMHIDEFGTKSLKAAEKNRVNRGGNMVSKTNSVQNEVASSSNNILANVNTIRQNTPLVSRLRKNEHKDYFESSFEESLIQNVQPDTTIKRKVPIYRQVVHTDTKRNLDDPYALDIIDAVKQKPKEKRRSSAKFNKSMYEILSKIEKKERKISKKKMVEKKQEIYEEKMNKVLKRVMSKVKENQKVTEADNQIILTNKSHHSVPDTTIKSNTLTTEAQTNVTLRTHPQTEKASERSVLHNGTDEDFAGFDRLLQKAADKIDLDISGDDFLGFDNRKQNNSKSIVENSNLLEESITDSTKHDSIVPSELISSPYPGNQLNSHRINILGNTVLRDKTISHSFNSSIVNDLLVNKSLNLHREFHNSVLLSNSGALHNDTSQDNDIDDNFDNDHHFEVSEKDEDSDDEYFGFDEISESPSNNVVQKRFSDKRKQAPWRFPNIFQRNPHLLKIKPNGLPSIQQEMVIDYEFVKRIEALSKNNVNKQPEPAPPKSPLQTTMLDYIHTDHEKPENHIHSSLFDYEEFHIPKSPRKILGVIHNNQIISTPKRNIEMLIESPNVSVIPKHDDIENVIPIFAKRVSKMYAKRQIEMVKEHNEDIHEDEPSVVEKDNPEGNDSVKLFEDCEGQKELEFSIQLPKIKYGKKRQRLKHHDEQGDEDQPKRKKKDMMTKSEKAEYEAWAVKINAQFEEDDKHELTIE